MGKYVDVRRAQSSMLWHIA